MSTTRNQRLDLRRLRLELAGEVIGPDDASYDAARGVFFPTVDRRPAAIVRPVDDAAVGIRRRARARERASSSPSAAADTALPGTASSDGGLVLDLGVAATSSSSIPTRASPGRRPA